MKPSEMIAALEALRTEMRELVGHAHLAKNDTAGDHVNNAALDVDHALVYLRAALRDGLSPDQDGAVKVVWPWQKGRTP